MFWPTCVDGCTSPSPVLFHLHPPRRRPAPGQVQEASSVPVPPSPLSDGSDAGAAWAGPTVRWPSGGMEAFHPTSTVIQRGSPRDYYYYDDDYYHYYYYYYYYYYYFGISIFSHPDMKVQAGGRFDQVVL